MNCYITILVRPCPHMSQPAQPSQMASRSIQPFLWTLQQKLPMLFNCADNAQKFPFPGCIGGPHLIHGSLGIPKSASQTASQSVQSFCRLTNVTNRHTDRLTTLLRVQQ